MSLESPSELPQTETTKESVLSASRYSFGPDSVVLWINAAGKEPKLLQTFLMPYLFSSLPIRTIVERLQSYQQAQEGFARYLHKEYPQGLPVKGDFPSVPIRVVDKGTLVNVPLPWIPEEVLEKIFTHLPSEDHPMFMELCRNSQRSVPAFEISDVVAGPTVAEEKELNNALIEEFRKAINTTVSMPRQTQSNSDIPILDRATIELSKREIDISIIQWINQVLTTFCGQYDFPHDLSLAVENIKILRDKNDHPSGVITDIGRAIFPENTYDASERTPFFRLLSFG